MGFFRQNIAVDLGTATILVSVENKGVVINEPSIVAIKDGSNKILAIGEEARSLMGRTPFDISTVKPIQNGVISSYYTTMRMLKYYFKKALRNPLKRILKPDVIICVPSQTTDVEKRAVKKASQDAGAARTFIISEPLAAAIGAGIDISKPTGNMIVDVGGGTTDIAVISYGGIVVSKSVKVAGDVLDETIKNYLKKTHNLLIGDRTAEQIKMEIGCVYHGIRNGSLEIRGSDLITGLPNERVITSEELLEPLMEAVIPILDGIHAVLEETPPELAADIYSRGIILTGGGALIAGLDELIRKSTGIDAIIADEPQYCVAKGCNMFIMSMTSKDKIEAGRIN